MENENNDNIRLGIDVGGSGIKGALVDITTGELQSERIRYETQMPATPEFIAGKIKLIVNNFEYSGPVGVAFPAAIQDGVIKTATNIDDSWLNRDAKKLLSSFIPNPICFINDADAAGLAEIKFGRGKDQKGVVIMITVGTGLGTALFTNGALLPNSELGHVHYKDKLAEKWASDATRKKKDLSWKKWAKRFDKYMHYLERLFYPELIIIGGGMSKKFDKFEKYLKRVKTKVYPAKLFNHAGIIGAAAETEKMTEEKST
jgi:polyphosphate glucokinase